MNAAFRPTPPEAMAPPAALDPAGMGQLLRDMNVRDLRRAWSAMSLVERGALTAADKSEICQRLADNPGPEKLLRTRSGDLAACELNARILIGECRDYDQLHYDTFLRAIRNGVKEWTDDDDHDVLCWLQSTYRVRFTLAQERIAIRSLARARSRDSLVDYVNGLRPWDGTPRIESALHRGWGAPNDPLTCAASRNLLIAMIARARQPGAQVDHLWAFEGPQGGYKSRALRKLGGDFHAEISAPVGTTDFLRELNGIWLAEFAELDSLRNREASTVKRLLSNPRDRYVEKYEVHPRSYPRRAVAVATTNEASYWQDPTGARRLIPIRTGAIQVDVIERERELWFAEARHLFELGAPWWEFPTSIVTAQEDRQQVDPWEDLLKDVIANGRAEAFGTVSWPQGWVSSASIMRDWLRLLPHQQGQSSSTRLGQVMRRLGFAPQRQGKGRERGWVMVGRVSAEASADAPPEADTKDT